MPSFAAPWFLLGLITACLPFLLLLTKANVKRTTQFSSVQFLWSITEHASNVIEWKRLLLLAVRVGLLSLVALVFALPFMSRMGYSAGGAARDHYAFVIDNSYGMGYGIAGNSLFEAAKNRARNMVKQSREKTAWSLYVFNNSFQLVLQRTDSNDEILKAIDEVVLSNFASDFSVMLPSARDLLSAAGSATNHVYIFSDFSFSDKEAASYFTAALAEERIPEGIVLVPVQPDAYSNLFLSRIVLPPRPLVPAAEEAILGVYESSGLTPGTEVEFTLWVENNLVSRQLIKTDETGRGFIRFTHTFPAAGQYALSIHASEDGLAADNVRHGVAEVKLPLKLLLVEDGEYKYPFENPYFYFSQAIMSYEASESAQSWISVERIHLDSLQNLDLKAYDVVVSADVFDYHARYIEKIKAFVQSGGTLFFSAGKTYDPEEKIGSGDIFNSLLGGYFGEAETVIEGNSFFRIDSIDYAHPLFSIFEEGKKGDLAQLEFHQFLRFFPTVEEDAYEVLLWFEQKWPALVERRLGQGKVFLWTTSLNQDWTTFPKDPLFVPFIFELLKYSSGGHTDSSSDLLVGHPLRFSRTMSSFDQILIKKPGGEQISLHGGIASALEMFPTDEAGIYYWYATGIDTSFEGAAAYNLNPNEASSYYVKIDSPAELVSTKSQSESINSLDGELNKDFIYRPMLYTVFFLIIAETWLSNRFYKPQWI